MNTGPQRLGKYEMQEHLERGGMGEVWKAYDTQLRRYVAIKLLQGNLRDNADFVARFTREAQFVAALHHPNIVQIHDFQFTDTRESGATAYMVMDYVEGGTLADYIRATSRKGQFPSAADIVSLFTAISLALDYAHRQGMVHRDIKPANILLDKRNPSGKPMGEPILTDFGIAKLQGATTSTLTGFIAGTPRYISPEQAQGQPGDERADLYSLGIILYEVLAGRAPFQGDNQISIMMQHIYEEPPALTLFNPRISPTLAAVVLRSIAKDAGQRFPSASAMTVALAQALNVAVPASLGTPPGMDIQADYNPLQPVNLAHENTPSTSHLTAPYPLSFTPIDSKVEAGVNTPVHRTPAPIPLGGSFPVPIRTPAFAVAPPFLRRRWLSIALIACSIIVLVGAGIGAIALFTASSHGGVTTTPQPSGVKVGAITFGSSKQGTNDQLQVDLQIALPAHAGKIYYAWLDTFSENPSLPPQWPLCSTVQHCSFTDAQHRNLLAQYDWFLIIEEDTSATSSIPPAAGRLYYADISHNGPNTFDIKMCPLHSSSLCR
ncbi:MAG: protein kinase [Ktedonobacteraceae bacterium]